MINKMKEGRTNVDVDESRLRGKKGRQSMKNRRVGKIGISPSTPSVSVSHKHTHTQLKHLPFNHS